MADEHRAFPRSVAPARVPDERLGTLALLGVLVASGRLDELRRQARDGVFRALPRQDIDAVFRAAEVLCGNAAADAARRAYAEARGGSDGVH